MGRWIAGALIGLVVGLGLGSVMFSESAVTGGLRPDSFGPLAAERGETEALAAPLAFEAPAGQRDGEPEGRGIVPASERRVAAALESTRRTALRHRRGESALWGTVLDGDGRGVGGVTLRAVLRDPSHSIDSPDVIGASAPDLSLEAAVSEAAAEHARMRAGLFEARTDTSGA